MRLWSCEAGQHGDSAFLFSTFESLCLFWMQVHVFKNYFLSSDWAATRILHIAGLDPCPAYCVYQTWQVLLFLAYFKRKPSVSAQALDEPSFKLSTRVVICRFTHPPNNITIAPISNENNFRHTLFRTLLLSNSEIIFILRT